jgi:hypothetical protein
LVPVHVHGLCTCNACDREAFAIHEASRAVG